MARFAVDAMQAVFKIQLVTSIWTFEIVHFRTHQANSLLTAKWHTGGINNSDWRGPARTWLHFNSHRDSKWTSYCKRRWHEKPEVIFSEYMQKRWEQFNFRSLTFTYWAISLALCMFQNSCWICSNLYVPMLGGGGDSQVHALWGYHEHSKQDGVTFSSWLHTVLSGTCRISCFIFLACKLLWISSWLQNIYNRFLIMYFEVLLHEMKFKIPW